MNVFDLRQRLVSDYARYTKSFIKIADPSILAKVDSELGAGAFWPEPLLQLNPTFQPGGTIDDLVADGTLYPELLSAQPDASPIQSLVDQQLPLLLGGLPDLQTALGKTATERAALQLQAHERVREATRHRAKVRIEPVLPVDILGAYLLLPVL